MTTGCQYLKTQLETIKKSLQKTFKDFALETAGESNLKIVNYLDVTLNLDDGFLRSCDKSDGIFQYVNKEFNHPPNLINHLPAPTILLIKKYFKNQLFIMKIHQIKQAT